jgi:hypothetical protein
MQRCWLLFGVFSAFGTLGCASWRQPVPQTADTRITAGPSQPLVVATQAATPTTAATTFTTPSLENQPPVLIVPVQHTSTQSKAEDPPLDSSDDPLTLFGDALKGGDKAAATGHLETYVQQHPDQLMFRLQLAELLIETNRDAKAKIHFEQFVAGAQAGPEAVQKYLVHAHTRLLEIGQRMDDPFAESFHRGVGMLILVKEQDKNPDRDDGFCEEMLCKSLRAFNDARELKPGDQRVRVYLAEVYQRMGNRRASASERAAARDGAFPGELTPAELNGLLERGL